MTLTDCNCGEVFVDDDLAPQGLDPGWWIDALAEAAFANPRLPPGVPNYYMPLATRECAEAHQSLLAAQWARHKAGLQPLPRT